MKNKTNTEVMTEIVDKNKEVNELAYPNILFLFVQCEERNEELHNKPDSEASECLQVGCCSPTVNQIWKHE